jgi:hypothetical protein
MALFSDVDWIILLGAAAFLLLGSKSGEVMRTIGRYYGRFLRLKQELLTEFSRAADLPVVATGAPPSIRNTLLASVEPLPASVHVPLAVATPPSLPPVGVVTATGFGAGLGNAGWFVATSTATAAPGVEG